jgi:hypothetical protein
MSKAPIRALFLDDDRGVAEATKEALASRGIEVISLAATARRPLRAQRANART